MPGKKALLGHISPQDTACALGPSPGLSTRGGSPHVTHILPEGGVSRTLFNYCSPFRAHLPPPPCSSTPLSLLPTIISLT